MRKSNIVALDLKTGVSRQIAWAIETAANQGRVLEIAARTVLDAVWDASRHEEASQLLERASRLRGGVRQAQHLISELEMVAGVLEGLSFATERIDDAFRAGWKP